MTNWCAIHIGCGGQLKATSVKNDFDYTCSTCGKKVSKDETLLFNNDTDILPQGVDAIDILQLDRKDRAELIQPDSIQENNTQKNKIIMHLKDKPLFF